MGNKRWILPWLIIHLGGGLLPIWMILVFKYFGADSLVSVELRQEFERGFLLFYANGIALAIGLFFWEEWLAWRGFPKERRPGAFFMYALVPGVVLVITVFGFFLGLTAKQNRETLVLVGWLAVIAAWVIDFAHKSRTAPPAGGGERAPRERGSGEDPTLLRS